MNSCFIRFYSDINNSGDSEGYNEKDPFIDSKEFEVVKKKTHSFTVYDIAGVGDTAINNMVTKAEKILLSRDSEEDYRAAVKISTTPGTSWSPGMPTEIIDIPRPPWSLTQDEEDALEEANKQNALDIWAIWNVYCDEPEALHILSFNRNDRDGKTYPVPLGLAYTATGGIILNNNSVPSGVNGQTFAHELGHRVGLWPVSHNPKEGYVMYAYFGGNRNQLNSEEAVQYHEYEVIVP